MLHFRGMGSILHLLQTAMAVEVEPPLRLKVIHSCVSTAIAFMADCTIIATATD